jgi:hypothetical protein
MNRAVSLRWPILLSAFLLVPLLAGCGGAKGKSPAAAAERAASPAGRSGAPGGPLPASTPPEARVPTPPPPVPPGDRRGYVVFVDGMRLVIDLADGEVKKDSLIAITRRQSLTHPVTGEPLGEIALEVGRARIVEIQAKFSVAELIGFKPGLTVKPQDRVTVLPASP